MTSLTTLYTIKDVEVTGGGGSLSSITDGTNIINDPTAIEFTGATVTANGTIAQVNIEGGGLTEIPLNRINSVVMSSITI